MKLKIGKRRFHRLHITTERKIGLLLISSLFFGVITGSLVPSFSADVQNVLIGYAQGINQSAPTANILLNHFIINFLFYSGLFLLGVSVYGYVFIPVFLFVKGFSYGFTASFFYSVFGTRGILVCALGLTPQFYIFSVALLVGSYLAFLKSRSFRQRTTDQYHHNSNMKAYCLTFLILFCVSFLTTLFDIFVTKNVINLFC